MGFSPITSPSQGVSPGPRPPNAIQRLPFKRDTLKFITHLDQKRSDVLKDSEFDLCCMVRCTVEPSGNGFPFGKPVSNCPGHFRRDVLELEETGKT